MRSFAAMLAEVQGLMQNSGTSYATKIKNAINRAYRSVAAKNNWPSLRAEEDFTTAGSTYLVLPMYVNRVLEIFDPSKNIWLQPRNDISKRSTATYSTSGTAYEWEAAGWSPVQTQPSAASAISIKGDGGTDTGTTVRITGKKYPATSSDVGYIIVSESEVTVGASAATTTAQFVEIISISKDADSDEDIIISAGATYLAYLAKERYASMYRKIRLHYTPASGTSLTIKFQRFPERLVEDQDAPLMPCSDAIVNLACAELLKEQKQFSKAQVMEMAARTFLDQLATEELGQDRGAEQAIPALGMRRWYV